MAVLRLEASRRSVGIDLGIASAHTVRVLDGEGTTLVKQGVADR